LKIEIFIANSADGASVPDMFKKWKIQNTWLQLNESNKGICTICTEATERKLIVSLDSRSIRSKQACVDDGFTNWKHGAERIKSHRESKFHIDCAEAIANVGSCNVIQSLSAAHSKQMWNKGTSINDVTVFW